MSKEVEFKLSGSKDLNAAGKPEWVSNQIRTTKYEWYNFLFINLWEQLHKFSTVYFLCISALMYLGEKTDLFIGTIKYFTTLAQQVCLMILSGAVALRDDYQRRVSDNTINNSPAERWSPTKRVFENKKWMDVRVGDVLKVPKEKEFPADIVPLYSTGERGTLFVSTANLDGETNLKTKSALDETQTFFVGTSGPDEKKLSQFECKVGAEAPVDNIHNFQGYLNYNDKQLSLGPEQLLLRGTVLRNTEYVVGVVVYTGDNTRMVLNSRKAPIKQSNIEKTTNTVMLLVLLTQGLLALFSDIFYQINKDSLKQHWYLAEVEITLPIWFAYWLTFFVLYSNLMPITLYGTVDVCNFFHAYFIKNDKRICYLDPDGGRDHFPAGVRATNLCQELGQVSYIFSDKTGTLTQNIMELKRAWIGDKYYGNRFSGFSKGTSPEGKDLEEDKPSNDSKTREFLEVLAVCHTVMVSDKQGPQGATKYEAESPDDEALVKGAHELGMKYMGRVGQIISVEESGSNKSEYTIVAINAFTSARKRMSAVVKVGSKEEYVLLAKGADNVLKPKLRDKAALDGLTRAVDTFAREGLRTLVIARKKLEAGYVKKWLDNFNNANADLRDRAGKLDEVANEIETDLELCGVTGIEDKLQDGVPDTIKKIRIAGIKFWVLTGDKLETAKEIGFSANVLDRNMTIHEVEKPKGDVVKQLKEVWDKCKPPTSKESYKQQQDRQGQQAVLITGDAIMDIMKDEKLKDEFLEIGKEVSIVMGCRVSPLQKQQMVRIVRDKVVDKSNRPVVTLAIGDGANDVPMIQTAEVGVGIKGKEGLQSVNNSDFAIGQFRYLERLMFVHGRWNYLRACKYTLFTFWRNAVQVFMIAFFTYISAYSGTSLFEDSIRITFNGFASVPIVATGMFDQDVDEKTAIAHPELYRVGREQVQLSLMKMGWTLLSAFSHSVILQLVWYCAFDDMALLGVGDYYSFGTACFTGLLFDVFYRNLFLQYTHNVYTTWSIIICFGGYVSYLVFLCFVEFMEPNIYQVPYKLASIAPFWVCIICAPMMAAAFDTFVDFILEYFSHTQWQLREDRVNALDSMAKDGNDQIGLKLNRFMQLIGYELFFKDGQRQQGETDPTRRPLVAAGAEDSTGSSEEKALPLRQSSSGKIDDDSEENTKYADAGISLSPFAQQTANPLISVDFFQTHKARYCNAMAVLVIGVFLLAVGSWVLSLAKQIVVQTEEYSHNETCEGADQCDVSIYIPSDFDSDVFVYYKVWPFFQNHNDYENSESIPELYGKWEELGDVQASRSKKCNTANMMKGEKAIVPCGMKATSMFNDTFVFKVDEQTLELSNTTIAWESDITRYGNPSIYGTKPDTISWLSETYPDIIKEDGVENPRFVSWMRPAAKNSVTNRLGFFKAKEIKGKTLTVTIQNVFPVEAWNGTKQLIFTEVNSMGGQEPGLGIFLCVCGVLCLFVSGAFMVWLNLNKPRSAGEQDGPANVV